MASVRRTTVTKKGANHSGLKSNLNRIEGQLNGIQKMVDEQRYCTEIIQQVRATRKALGSVEALLIESHIRSCVQTTLDGKSKRAKNEKLDEVIRLFKSSIG